jgi:hypothetical protein
MAGRASAADRRNEVRLTIDRKAAAKVRPD